MGQVRWEEPVMLMCGMIGADRALFDEAGRALASLYGPVELVSDDVPFEQTDYYRTEMGLGLWRRLLVFRRLMAPCNLAGVKLKTQALEQAYACNEAGRETRRVNLDPGYIAPAKLVLATTKDFAHRISIGQGIYAEVTLNFCRWGIRTFDWTYPDFKGNTYHPFLLAARRRLLKQRRRHLSP